jgi:hypothetical protein
MADAEARKSVKSWLVRGDAQRRGEARKHAATKPAQRNALRARLSGGVETPPFHRKNLGSGFRRCALSAPRPVGISAPPGVDVVDAIRFEILFMETAQVFRHNAIANLYVVA